MLFLPELEDGLRRNIVGRSPKLEKANRDKQINPAAFSQVFSLVAMS